MTPTAILNQDLVLGSVQLQLGAGSENLQPFYILQIHL